MKYFAPIIFKTIAQGFEEWDDLTLIIIDFQTLKLD
jgi:hypothetical protein